MTHYVSRVQTYYCDGGAAECNRSYEEQGTARDVWAEARREGWRTKNGQHFCPAHSPTEQEQKR